MKKTRDSDLRIAAEAAHWQRVLERGGAAENREFTDWIKASPRHLREFLFMESLDSAAKQIDPALQPDLDVELAKLDETVVPLHDMPSLPPARRASLPVRFASAAAVLIAVAGGLAWWTNPSLFDGWQRYDTAVGEQRSVQLQDGSVLELNTDSRVRVRFSDSARDIQLVSGEALFKVSHDAARPFRVNAGDVVIRAVGTQFNVYRRSDETTVAVVEGKVEIRTLHPAAAPVSQPSVAAGKEPGAQNTPASAQLVAAGEAVRIENDREIVRDAQADVSEATAWQQRRLVFREDSLARIAEEFNRYNTSPRIVIEGDAARARRYGGTFDADDPESLVLFVVKKDQLIVERTADRIILRAR